MKFGRALTLVELLVVISLLGFISLGVIAALSGGVRVWRRVGCEQHKEREVQLALEDIKHKLRNLRRFNPIPFEGEYDTLSFAALVASDRSKEISGEIGQIHYFLKKNDRTLYRSQCPYPMLRNREFKSYNTLLCTGIDALRFTYYCFDNLEERYVWSNTWSSLELPLAVKAEVSFVDEFKKDTRTQSAIISLPISSSTR